MKKISSLLFVITLIGLMFIPFSEVEYYSPNYQAIKVSEKEFKVVTGIPNCNIITQNIYGYEISNLALCPLSQTSTMKLESLDTGTLRVIDDSLFMVLKNDEFKNSLAVVNSLSVKVDTLSLIKHGASQHFRVESKEEIEETYIWFRFL